MRKALSEKMIILRMRNTIKFLTHQLKALLSHRLLFMLTSLLLTLGILGWLLWNQYDMLLNYPWDIDIVSLLYAFSIYSLVLFMSTLVWGWITGSIVGKKISFWKHFRAFCISALGKRLPGTVWYVAWRAQIYGEEGLSARAISLASGIEVAVSMLSAVIVSFFFAIPILVEYRLSVWGLVVILAFSLVLVHPSVIAWFRGRLGLNSERINRNLIVVWVLSYVVIRILFGLFFFMVINIFYSLPWQNLPYVIGGQALVAGLSMLLLFLPSNFGFAEVSLSLLLSSIMPSSIAVIVVILNRILTIFFEFIWSFIVIVNELIHKGSS